ncbi:ABC transporter permease [Nocardioides nanhaiensis]|uniref:ABC transporter permease n=1 Tax=Nocardioides nanhaiensis TaxID=1476871 RepID=A0ABP8W8E3_9ACTN
MTFLEYLSNNYDNLLELSVEHIRLVLISMGIALAAGLPLGVLAHRYRITRAPILGVASFFLTLPSLALFALFIPLLGLGAAPAIAGLTLYALLPIISNTVAGLGGVDPAIVKASRGMGLGPTRRLLQVEMPLAWPVIITGIRVSTLVVVGIASIAALVGGPGLGQEIFRGIRSVPNANAPNLIYGGTLAIIVLALAFDAVFVLIKRFTTSRGIR